MSKNVNNLKELEKVLVDSLDRDILYNFTINNYSLEYFLITLEEEEKVYRVRIINNLYNTYNQGDSVQLIYYDSLKTAKIFAKN